MIKEMSHFVLYYLYSSSKKMLDGVRQKFPYCEDLELYNSGSNDDNVAYEQWLIKNGK